MNITYSKQALKQMSKLNKSLRDRIIGGVENLPKGDIKKLKGYTHAYRLRIGDYRILFNFTANNIEITDVLPRGEAYKG